MKFVAPTLAFALALTFAPAFAGDKAEDQVKADEAQPAPSKVASEASPAPAKQAVTAEASKAEEKRICRRISLEMGSRRKEKVCLTKEGWRDFNQGK